MSAQITTNPIIVAGKPVANYALAIQARLAAGETTIQLRARGKHIATAANAANMAVNLGLLLQRGEVRMNQESGPNGKMVSFVEIELLAAMPS